MTYIIGDRKIGLSREVTAEDEKLIIAHPEVFRYCLNDVMYQYLIRLKKIIHLYGDIMTIYATLLKKITNYDDVTAMTNHTKLDLLQVEEDFNCIFGTTFEGHIGCWEGKSYETNVKKLSLLCIETANEIFETVMKTLNSVDVFFSSFDNLMKLSIPFLLEQTLGLQKSLSRTIEIVNVTTIADEVNTIKSVTPTIVNQLKKIEKVTTSIEKESHILDVAFRTFDPSLQQYTSILLGRAILKRDIDPVDCQILKRRSICHQAGEHVVSIPLTEDQNSKLSMTYIVKYFSYALLAVSMVVAVMMYRLLKVLI